MNEADRALIGVGEMRPRREYTDLYRKPSPSGAACLTGKIKATRTRRLLPYHPADGTVEVHRPSDGDLTVATAPSTVR